MLPVGKVSKSAAGIFRAERIWLREIAGIASTDEFQ
jgi:hypothetical protein